ncbi:MAG: BspA family leucine-rich repeat surface protein [Prevotella sp.]|nr:BspA family leucine-rich repeat surface protein [Prevotella sp.]
MKKVFLSIILLIAVVQGTWATAYKYYIVEKSGSTLFFKGSNTAPSGANQWFITDNNTTLRCSWFQESTAKEYTKVVFEPSFAEARPTTMASWFFMMENLESIEGLIYLNTSEVTDMSFLFSNCRKLKELNLIYFDTSKVKTMACMFLDCVALEKIYVGDGWDTSSLRNDVSQLELGAFTVFWGCNNLVGDDGMKVDYKSTANEAVYAHTGEGGFLSSEDAYWNTHEAEDFREIGEDTYMISNKGEMALLAKKVNTGTTYAGKTFVLSKDFIYNGETNNYTPIGSSDTKFFAGTFDGQGHTISGINLENNGRQALFATIGGDATIKNITLDNSSINNTGKAIAAGIVGRIADGGTIENCHVTENVTITGMGFVGGIVGNTDKGRITIAGCTCGASITNNGSDYPTGGIAAYLGFDGVNGTTNVVVKDCLYYGNMLSGTEKVTGGIAGKYITSNISSVSFSDNFYTYPDASLKAIGNKAHRNGTVKETFGIDIEKDHGAVHTRVVSSSDEIEEMGSQSGAAYAKGIAIFDEGALYNNIYYSVVPEVFQTRGISTDIKSVDNGQFTKDNSWYTLDGRKLSEKPTQKGIYIYNGKKVMING